MVRGSDGGIGGQSAPEVTLTEDEVGQLVGNMLPRLQEKIPVHIRTKRLPKVDESAPRLVMETKKQGEFLVVRPTIVYGDPPTARIIRGALEIMGDAHLVFCLPWYLFKTRGAARGPAALSLHWTEQCTILGPGHCSLHCTVPLLLAAPAGGAWNTIFDLRDAF